MNKINKQGRATERALQVHPEHPDGHQRRHGAGGGRGPQEERRPLRGNPQPQAQPDCGEWGLFVFVFSYFIFKVKKLYNI
jgi:hypothetical protein